MAYRYVMCKHMLVKRKASDGTHLPIERFSTSYDDPSTVAAILRKRGHTLVEFLYGALQLLGKLYFDADRDTGQCEPTPEMIEGFRLEVVERMERYMAIIRRHVPGVSYVVAQRHGYCPKKKGFKMSFRTFVSGIAIHHADCKAFIAALDPEAGFWDMLVYTRIEQLMCAINGKKGKGDERILTPLDPSHLDDERILQYVVQHVEPGWFHIDPQDMEECDGDDEGGNGVGEVVVDGDDSIVRLVRCLGRATSDSRDDWIRVGMILKGLGGDAYYPAWLEFSRISDKFESERDCAKTWRSLVAVEATIGAVAGRLTMGTLRYFAKRDDPVAYQAWRASCVQHEQHEQPAQTPAPSWDTCHVVRAAANVISSDGEVGVDARVEGGDVLFSSDETEYRVRLSTLGVTSVSGDNPTYIHGAAPGVSCGNLVIPNTVAPSQGWNMTRPTQHNVHLKSDGPPRTELLLDMNGDAVIRATVNYPDSNKKVLLRSTKALLAMLDATCREAIRGHLQSQLMVPANIVNNIVFAVNNGTINNYSGGGGDGGDDTPFTKMRDVVLAYATTHRLRKLGDTVWRPVQGCPLAYEPAETFKALLNTRLRHEPAYTARTAVHKELVEMLMLIDLAEFRDVVWDMDMFSFDDGVFLRSEERFVPYADAVLIEEIRGSQVAASVHDDDPAPLIARVHVKSAFLLASNGTPLIDKVLSDQFSPAVVGAFYVLVGRLFYRVGERDKWQVMPWFFGLSGTGKSLIMDVITSLFFKGAVGVLSSNNEQVFGLADKFDKQLLVGRDLPRNMSAVLAQDILQCMVTGEDICVPSKNLTARAVKWTTPSVFCSNHAPDYPDNAGQVVRRIVIFPMRNAVATPEMDLLDRIRATELPSFLAKALRAYHAAIEEHGNRSFWSWCPEELRDSQRRLGTETSLVRRFMALGPDDQEAVMDDEGGVVYPRRDPGGRSTALTFMTRAYDAFLVRHHRDVKTPEKMTKESLAVAGFVTEDRVNTCHACGLTSIRGSDACCASYDRVRRPRGVAVIGVVIVR